MDIPSTPTTRDPATLPETTASASPEKAEGPALPPAELGPARVVLEGVEPSVDDGRFPARRFAGDRVTLAVRLFADGHDVLAGAVHFRPVGGRSWTEVPLGPLGNDRWAARVRFPEAGLFEFRFEGWVDRFATWRRGLRKKADAGQDVGVDLLAGSRLLEEAAEHGGDAREVLQRRAKELADASIEMGRRVQLGSEPWLEETMRAALRRRCPSGTRRAYPLRVEPEKARFSAWYELFPRSAAAEEGQHGTLRDVVERLDDIRDQGFDVLYLPPIHPIGRVHRKGRNNARTAEEGDVGSPWAIGAEEGGHTAIHPDLGTFEDFAALVAAAGERGIDVALDIAFQCAPDHPWVKEHPEWFRHRADGSIQYAENPPKKYEDIYPIDFESDDWRNLWQGLRDVFQFWVEKGVRVFRVDNPHTKSLRFWEWAIASLKAEHPDLIFLSEAFTRPALMYRLSKAGFTQSYTYFAWKNASWELEQFGEEVFTAPVNEFFNPNFWPNTPDILNEYLQIGGPNAFAVRLVLAATMSASYGIYGPAFELYEGTPRHPGSEEYLDSEKYQLRHWDWQREDSLRPLVRRLNRIRRETGALRANFDFRVHPVDNEQLFCFSKRSPEDGSVVVVVVNLDPHHVHAGWIELDLDAIGGDARAGFQVHDLLSDARFLWRSERVFVQLDPNQIPAHVFRVRHRVRTEADFEYFL